MTGFFSNFGHRAIKCIVAGVVTSSGWLCLMISVPAAANGNAVMSAKVMTFHVEGGAFLSFDKAISNPDGCASAGVVLLPDDLQQRDAYISMIMTALASGKRVHVWVSGCGWSPWYPSVPKVYAMQIVA